MNIDEFLDRELSQIVSNKDSAERGGKSPSGLSDLEASYTGDRPGDYYSSLFEGIRAKLENGKIDEAEQSYVQVWGILLQKRLSWDKGLYEQLSAASRNFSAELEKSYRELKEKSIALNGLFSKARQSLKEGKNELPFKLYSEAEALVNSAPTVFFEEKRLLQIQLMDFYKELKTATDIELLRRVSRLLQDIYRLISRIGGAITSNDIASAKIDYGRCAELYNSIPEGFLRQKNMVGEKILEIYRTLSIHNEITALQKQLNVFWGQPASQRIQRPSYAASPRNFSRKALITKDGFEPGKSNEPGNADEQMDSLKVKKEKAWQDLKKGLYEEASAGAEEILLSDPGNAEAKIIRAKVKTTWTK